MAKMIRKPYNYWLKKITGRDFKEGRMTQNALGVDFIAGSTEDIVAKGFEDHGRCSECGWFGGHCSHTATLNPMSGRYETADQSQLAFDDAEKGVSEELEAERMFS
jgi:hypothetical protein